MVMDLTLRMGQHFADQLVKGREKGVVGGERGWEKNRYKNVMIIILMQKKIPLIVWSSDIYSAYTCIYFCSPNAIDVNN